MGEWASMAFLQGMRVDRAGPMLACRLGDRGFCCRSQEVSANSRDSVAERGRFTAEGSALRAALGTYLRTWKTGLFPATGGSEKLGSWSS